MFRYFLRNVELQLEHQRLILLLQLVDKELRPLALSMCFFVDVRAFALSRTITSCG